MSDEQTARARVIYTRLREEIIRHAATLEDEHLSALTIVVKLDRKTGLPGAILWRPEYETVYPAGHKGGPSA